MTGTDASQRERALAEFIQHRIQRNYSPYGPGGVTLFDQAGTGWYHAEPEPLGMALLEDAEFRALRLGGWLSTPDGALISRAVALVIPQTYRPEYSLLVAGLTHAAKLQREGQLQSAKELAGGVVLAGLVTLAVAAMYASPSETG